MRWSRSEIEWGEVEEMSHWMEQEHRKGLEDSRKMEELAGNQ